MDDYDPDAELVFEISRWFRRTVHAIGAVCFGFMAWYSWRWMLTSEAFFDPVLVIAWGVICTWLTWTAVVQAYYFVWPDRLP